MDHTFGPDADCGEFGIVVKRVDKPIEIDEVTAVLGRLTKESNGRYDGWESVIVTA